MLFKHRHLGIERPGLAEAGSDTVTDPMGGQRVPEPERNAVIAAAAATTPKTRLVADHLLLEVRDLPQMRGLRRQSGVAGCDEPAAKLTPRSGT